MPAPHRVIRVFVSSPADVRPERLIAEQVVRRLDREFASHFRVEAVLWEREPLTADAHFQDLLVPPRETDIVVVLLWSRLGLTLPTDRFLGPLSGRPVSGTEWEFEDALKAKRELGQPDLLLYRKTARVEGWLDDEREVAQRLEQRLLVRRFLERWVGDAEQGAFRAAFWDFADAATFETMLEQHLRALLRRQIAEPAAAGAARPANWHRGSPYRGLLAFEVEHAPVFFGRRRARNELRELLARQAARGSAFVLVVGASGSGKSSVVKAGLLPDLLLPGMMPRVALCRYAIIRPGDVSEAEGDPLAGLAAALCGATALPELAELRYTPQRLAELMSRAPEQVALAVEQGLDRAGAAARLTALGQARLALLIDQLEELFTTEAITPAVRERYVAALEALARSGQVWVIATLRSDFFDRVETLPALAALSGGEARYLLTPPDAAEIGQIIRQPAQEAGLRFEVDSADGKSLDEVIQAAVSTDAASLPLLQYLLEQLWQARGPGGVLTYDVYRRLGGLEGAIGRRAEALLAELPELVRGAFPALLRALVTIGGTEATATARQVPVARFPQGTPARLLIDALLRPVARILVVEGEGNSARLRVSHEALLTHWPRAAEQIAVDRRDLQVRGRLEEAAARWRAAAADERDSLLLARGVPLSEAEALLARRRDELEPELIAYVEASGTAARAAERRRLRRLQLVATALGLLAVLAGGGAAVGWLGQREAQRQEQAARQQEAAARARLTEAQVAQSRFLAERSRDTLAAGDAEKAQLLALAGLPGEPGEPDRPLVAEAVAALAQAALADRHRGVLSGHRSIVLGLGFSSDGERLLSVSMGDRLVRLWDARDGMPIWSFDGQAQRTAQLALSPTAGILAEIAADGTARLWDVQAGKTIATLDGEAGPVSAVTLNRAGDRLASGWKNGSVRLHDARTGTVLATFDGAAAPVRWLEFSGDGTRVVFGAEGEPMRIWQPGDAPTVVAAEGSATVKTVVSSADGERLAASVGNGTIRLWDARSGAAVAELGGHGEGLPVFAFNADGSRLASAGRDGTIRLWDGRGGQLLTTLEHGGTFAFSPDGLSLATAAPDGPTRLFATGDGAPAGELAARGGGVRTLSFSPDGKQLAVLSSDDGRIRLWDWRRGELTAELPADAKFAVMSFSPDGAQLATVGTDRTVHLWAARRDLAVTAYTKAAGTDHTMAFDPDRNRALLMSGTDTARLIDLRDGGERALTAPGQRLWAAAFSPDGSRVVTGSQAGTVRLWETASGKPLAELRGHQARVLKIVFNADGSRFATRSFDGTARLWDGRSGAALAGFEEADVPLRDLTFNAQGTRLATSARNGMIRLWDGQTGAAVANFSASPAAVLSLAFSPDGGRLAAGGEDGAVRLWDPRNGSVALELRGPEKAIRWLGFHRDGGRLAALGDTALRLWNAAGGALAEVKDPSGRISAATFSPDGNRLVTAGSDGTIRLWDARDGAAVAELRGHSQSVWGMAFGRDNGRLASVSLDTTVRQWDLGATLLSPAALIASRRAAALRSMSSAERDDVFLTAPAAGAAQQQLDLAELAAHHAKLAERHGRGVEAPRDPAQALFHHAVAARLYELQHQDAEAAAQRLRRGTLARSLAPEQAARVWREAEAWRPGDHSSD